MTHVEAASRTVVQQDEVEVSAGSHTSLEACCQYDRRPAPKLGPGPEDPRTRAPLAAAGPPFIKTATPR
ncbi:hypothetical protein ACWEV4_34930, partial [Streptomyces sp. NPDC003860]